jgi:hypothetical protein
MDKYKMSSIQTGIKVYNSIEEALDQPWTKKTDYSRANDCKTLPVLIWSLEKSPFRIRFILAVWKVFMVKTMRNKKNKRS